MTNLRAYRAAERKIEEYERLDLTKFMDIYQYIDKENQQTSNRQMDLTQELESLQKKSTRPSLGIVFAIITSIFALVNSIFHWF